MKFGVLKLIGFSFAFYGKSNIKEFLTNKTGGLMDSYKAVIGEEIY